MWRLAEPCDFAAQPGGVLMVQSFATDPDRAGIRRCKARDKRQQGGFSAAAGRHHRNVFAGTDGQGEIGENVEGRSGMAKGKAIDFD